ncbi:hypothetical protein PSRA_0522 [Pseudoscardovia radai]|uniref:Uncharacterized protein n=1 Tax=Pseudoscardovia radai TaxID=987066 RepID=A0A261EZS3_9BIFI|nr:hypothetical protein PSRA_0522 [Pseudoscardovia radai]
MNHAMLLKSSMVTIAANEPRPSGARNTANDATTSTTVANSSCSSSFEALLPILTFRPLPTRKYPEIRMNTALPTGPQVLAMWKISSRL